MTWRSYVVNVPPPSISALTHWQQRLFANVPPLIYAPPLHHWESDNVACDPAMSSTPPKGVDFTLAFAQTCLYPPCIRGVRYDNLKSFHTASYSNEYETKKIKCQSQANGFVSSRKRASYVDRAGHGKVRRFNCSTCSRKFHYMCHLKVHERVHTREKPYGCDVCSRSFSQSGSLRVHMRRHTGVKPYQCCSCWRKFRHVNSLLRHQRQVHNFSNDMDTTSTGFCDRKGSFDAIQKKRGKMKQICDASIMSSEAAPARGLSNHYQAAGLSHVSGFQRAASISQER